MNTIENQSRAEYGRSISKPFYAFAGLEAIKRRISTDKALDVDARLELNGLANGVSTLSRKLG